MNSIQDKINLIKQSIEDKSGKTVIVFQGENIVTFYYEEIQPTTFIFDLPWHVLELLPLSLPNKEGWIAVEERLPENSGHNFSDRVLVGTREDGVVAIARWDYELNNWNVLNLRDITVWHPLPPAPVKKSSPSKFDEINNGKNLPHF